MCQLSDNRTFFWGLVYLYFHPTKAQKAPWIMSYKIIQAFSSSGFSNV